MNFSYLEKWTGKIPCFSDDYAFLIQALDSLTGNNGRYRLFEKAKALTDYVIENFSEDGNWLFLLHTSKTRKM